jgi:ornithine--oxo-acid transaminase
MSTRSQKWIEEENHYCAQNYFPLPVVLSKGEGAYVWDLEGKRYLDLMTAYSANSFGHGYPPLVKALTEQAHQLSLVSRAFHCDTLLPFVKKLCEFTALDQVLPMNSGAEAVETAIKGARRWGYRHKNIPAHQAEVIVAKNNFHGRTLSIISFSSEVEYKADFGPYTPGFIEIPFGDANALREKMNAKTCAFLVEPIQGEAGIIVPPSGWLKECEKICKENNVLLIVDEIQSGLGRTGKRFAYEHDNVKPDGVIVGKALGGGLYPVSAFVGKNELMSVFNPGSHGSTFGGNPLAARIGYEVLTLLEEGDFIQRSERLGKLMLERLRAIQHPAIKAVRGKGLWAGVELDPTIAPAREVCEKLLENGVLTKEAHSTVIRFAPPFIIEEDDLLSGVEIFEKVLSIWS